MLDSYQLTLHGLTLRQLATTEQLADVTGQPVEDVAANLEKAAADGAVKAARGANLITPVGREALDAVYPEAFAGLRADAEVGAAMAAFESGANEQIKALTTEWQTNEAARDGVVDKLGRVVEKTGTVLAPLVAADPLVGRFLERIDTALLRAEGGETEYVSGIRVDSVHTVWFQMHEHLLRLTGRERTE